MTPRELVVFFAPAAVAALLLLGVLDRALRPGSGARLLPLLAADADGERHGGGRAAALLGFGFLAACFAALELRQPYYFVQDDNFGQFLPTILHACQVAAQGAFPEWNPHQYLGAPTGALGVYALTYPPTYLSCWTAGPVLGDRYLALEVFAALHMAAGYFAALALVRREGVRPALAVAAALSFVLSGYVLIAGRSWYYMLPVVTWFPVLLLCVQQLRRGAVGWRWALLAGAAVGAYFHAGNVQMWSYSLLLCAVAVGVLWVSGTVPGRRLAWCIPALLIGMAIAAPLLAAQLWATSDTLRVAEGSGPILRGIYALLLPYPLVRAGHPLLWGTADVERMGHMYYAGTVFTAAGLFGMALLFVALVRRRVPWRPLLGGNPWLCCAAVALVLSLGSYGGLWLLLRALPGFSRFNFAFKFLPLLTLLLVLGGAVLLERLVSARHRPRRWGAGLAAATVALLAYHVGQARPSFFTFGAAPYPRPPADIGRLLAAPGTGAGRLWPLAPERSTDPSYPQAMRLNLATVHGLHAVFGYDPLVGATPVWEAAATRLGVTPVEAARAYGVRWVLVHRTVYQPVFGPNPEQAWLERFSDAEMERLSRLLDGATRRTASGGIELWEIAQPAPLVFDSASGVAITSAWAPQDLVVRPGAMREPRAVVINLLHRRGFRATADGRPLALRADSWGRMVATLPAGTSRVEVDYRAPWHVGIWAALALAAIAAAVGAWLTRGTRGLRP